jgi:LysW-gamma-L-lysine carboxypeptidase
MGSGSRWEPRFVYKTGTADIILLPKYGNALSSFGPGDSILDHTAIEYIELKEYSKAVEVLINNIIYPDK